MTPVTKRQREMLTFLSTFIGKHGYAPSLEEIARGLGLSAISTVHKHLTNLEHRGLVKRRWNRARHLELTTPDACPYCGHILREALSLSSIQNERKVVDSGAGEPAVVAVDPP